MAKKSTFHESWYKVAKLKLSLRISLRMHRQQYRGELWYILQDPVNNSFFRLNRAVYQFFAMLDGRRSVNEIWEQCLEDFDDMAPTQGEVIQLLGQLYTSNLLQGNVPIDTESLLKRRKERIRKEWQGQLKGIMFAKIPLWDPNFFLDRWLFLFGWLFSRFGLVLFAGLSLSAVYFLLSNYNELSLQAQNTLSPNNLPYLFGVFVAIKLIHEFGHGFACKYTSKTVGEEGEVHQMGIMLMVLTPIPFVDATSSWALESKWRRILVAAAGMYIELILAAISAIVWTNSGEGHPMHIISYNVMLVASVTTVLFNGNPLLKYDAYYMLSDWLEIPNLASKSQLYFFYLVKKYLWGVKAATTPTVDFKEKSIMLSYAVLAYLYRLVIFSSIFFFLADTLLILGLAYGVFMIYTFMLAPINKLIKFLKTSPELRENRQRAISFCLATAALIICLTCLIPVRNTAKVEAVIDPSQLIRIHAQSDGFLLSSHKTGTPVLKGKSALIQCENKELQSKELKTLSRIEELEIEYKFYLNKDVAKSQIALREKEALEEKVRTIRQEIDQLTIKAPIDGHWVSPKIHEKAYLKKGDEIGFICQLDKLELRAVLPQATAQVLTTASKIALVRLKGRPDIEFKAEITEILEYGRQELPSAALGYAGGGDIDISQEQQDSKKAKEKIFEITLDPRLENEDIFHKLRSGQVVIVKFSMPEKALIHQGLLYIRQLFQKRLHI